MNFIEETIKSVYSPEFYANLKEAPVKHSISYFFKLSCLLALLSTFIFSIFFIPRFIKITDSESIESLIQIFPKELTITIQAGHLSTNVPEPYAIKMPENLAGMLGGPKSDSVASSTGDNLVVISTQADPSLSQVDAVLKSFNSHVLVTATHIVSKDNNDKITSQSLASFPNSTIDQAKFRELATKIRPLLKFIIPIGIPFIFLGFIIFLSLNLLFGLIIAIFTLLLGKILKLNIDYWHSYAITLRAMTLGMVSVFAVSTLMSFLPFEFTLPRFAFSILTFIVVYINLRNSSSKTPEPAI